jgi:hypothetical protein
LPGPIFDRVNNHSMADARRMTGYPERPGTPPDFELDKNFKKFIDKTLWYLRLHGVSSTARNDVYLHIGVNTKIPELFLFGLPGTDLMYSSVNGIRMKSDSCSTLENSDEMVHYVIKQGEKFIERYLQVPESSEDDKLYVLKVKNAHRTQWEYVKTGQIASRLGVAPRADKPLPDEPPFTLSLTEIIDGIADPPDKLFVYSCAEGRPIPLLREDQYQNLTQRFWTGGGLVPGEALIQTLVRDTIATNKEGNYKIGGKYETVNLHPAVTDKTKYPSGAVDPPSDFHLRRLLVWLKLTYIHNHQEHYYKDADGVISRCVNNLGKVAEFNNLFRKFEAVERTRISDTLFLFNYLSFNCSANQMVSNLHQSTFEALCEYYGFGKVDRNFQVTDPLLSEAIRFVLPGECLPRELLSESGRADGGSVAGSSAATMIGIGVGAALAAAASLAGAFA